MLRIFIIILLLLPTASNADQGLNISCFNMKSVLGRKYDPLKFTLQAVGLQKGVVEGDTLPTMTMSKYDFKKKKFLEHYKCDAETGNIE